MKYCTNCGNQIEGNDTYCKECGEPIEGVKYCPNCGKLMYATATRCSHCGHQKSQPTYQQATEGKALATVSVVFGSLGFYPLIIIGSIVGLVCAIIGINDPYNQFEGRSKIGLGLSIGSLGLWLFILFIGLLI